MKDTIVYPCTISVQTKNILQRLGIQKLRNTSKMYRNVKKKRQGWTGP